MKRAVLGSMILVAASIGVVYLARGNADPIRDIVLTGATVAQYEPVEISAALAASYKNPYDSDEVALSAGITAPDGQTVSVPAFYTGRGSLWKIRFTPVKAGRHTYRLLLKSRPTEYVSGAGQFEVVPSNSDGFLRRGGENPFYPVFDSGRPFFGLGHNIGWTKDNAVAEYEKYFAVFKENGCNLTRIWINSAWTPHVENARIGEYDAADCEKIDSIISLAKRYGIYVIIVLDSYGSLMEERGYWNEQAWKTNPYNKANGGPCDKPQDFFTNPAAKRYYKNRLRYMIGRWGYSPNVMAFELWNEFDAPPDWTAEMASYIKSINPHGQFITTSLGYPWANNFDDSSVWGLDEIDIIERHVYGNTAKDLTENIITINRELVSRYKKRLLVGELGMDVNKNDADIDIAGNGVALHNGLWAAALSGSFATSLNWWWDEYIRANDLYPHYRAIKNFLTGVRFDSRRVEFLKTTPLRSASVPEASYTDVNLNTNEVWGDTLYDEFTINNNGDCLGGIPNAYLHGTSKAQMRIEPVFHVNYPAEGKFMIRVGTVSQGGRLVIYLDGKEAIGIEFPAGAGTGGWKESKYLKDHDIYQCIYDTLVEIKVPKGEHVIKLSNTGKDWLDIRRITLSNYGSANFVNARVAGLRVGDQMLFWAQNKEYTWLNDINCVNPSEIKGASFSISGIEDGTYEAEWWDTFKGEIISAEKITAKDDKLDITLPSFTKDIACKIRRAP